MQSELASSIPVIGTAFKMMKGLDDWRTRIFQAKLESFLTAPGMQAPSVVTEWKRKMESSPDEANQIGETLFLVVDKVIDTRKPPIFAKVFIAHLDGKLSGVDLLRVVAAIDSAFIEDLEQLASAKKPATATLQNLMNTGLVEINYTALFGGFNSMDFRLNHWGSLLKRILSTESANT